MCSDCGWDYYKKAQTWFVGLVKYLYLTAEPGVDCLLLPYWFQFHYFVRGQNYVAMSGLLQPRWRVAD